jgi:hypothetical protein
MLGPLLEVLSVAMVGVVGVEGKLGDVVEKRKAERKEAQVVRS